MVRKVLGKIWREEPLWSKAVRWMNVLSTVNTSQSCQGSLIAGRRSHVNPVIAGTCGHFPRGLPPVPGPLQASTLFPTVSTPCLRTSNVCTCSRPVPPPCHTLLSWGFYASAGIKCQFSAAKVWTNDPLGLCPNVFVRCNISSWH